MSTFDGRDATGQLDAHATNLSGNWTFYLTPWTCGREGGLALGPYDEVAVVHVHNNMSAAQGFTRNRKLLLNAVDRIDVLDLGARSNRLADPFVLSNETEPVDDLARKERSVARLLDLSLEGGPPG